MVLGQNIPCGGVQLHAYCIYYLYHAEMLHWIVTLIGTCTVCVLLTSLMDCLLQDIMIE
jgi:hypothetical protein